LTCVSTSIGATDLAVVAVIVYGTFNTAVLVAAIVEEIVYAACIIKAFHGSTGPFFAKGIADTGRLFVTGKTTISSPANFVADTVVVADATGRNYVCTRAEGCRQNVITRCT
tara:strand:+ start:152 stop:487 length:336 start_codon:yes stop_codon:yes gene_type:complete